MKFNSKIHVSNIDIGIQENTACERIKIAFEEESFIKNLQFILSASVI